MIIEATLDKKTINSQNYDLTSGNISTTISDHLPQFSFLEIFFRYKSNFHRTIWRRDYKKFSIDLFRNELININWEPAYSSISEINTISTTTLKNLTKFLIKLLLSRKLIKLQPNFFSPHGSLKACANLSKQEISYIESLQLPKTRILNYYYG